jgi:hypothetical protein
MKRLWARVGKPDSARSLSLRRRRVRDLPDETVKLFVIAPKTDRLS